jgi:hypothetical protein
MEYIKRGEMPPEFKSLSAGGRQVEVNNKNSENKLIYY